MYSRIVKANYCCKDCEDRVVGCHSTCELYLADVKARREKQDMIYEARNRERILNKAKKETIKRMEKRKRK